MICVAIMLHRLISTSRNLKRALTSHRTPKLSFLLLFSIFLPLFGFLDAEPIPVSFQMLKDLDSSKMDTASLVDQEITIRGFLYQDVNQKWILASEPNLKTCCVGSEKKVKQQIVLSGTFAKQLLGQAVTLNGIFTIEPQYTNEGSLTGLYYLKNAIIEKNETKSWPLLTLTVVLFGLCVTWVSRRFVFKKELQK